MKAEEPQAIYQQLIQKHQAALELHLKKRKLLGWTRFIVFIITIFICYQVFVQAGLWGIIPLVTGIGVLLFLVSLDVNNNQKISNTRTLIKLNEEELEVLAHRFHQREDGAVYNPALHDYANDLDLFGKASVYQWASRCFTEQGKALLVKNLLEPLPSEEVRERHEAVKELAPMVEWRQQLQALAMQNTISAATEKRTASWLAEEDQHFKSGSWKIIVWIYSIITLSSALAAILGYIPGGIFSFLYGIFLVSSIILSRNTVKPYVLLTGIVKEIGTLQNIVEWTEQQAFKSVRLEKIMSFNAGQSGPQASAEIRELKSILDRFDLRLNIAGLLFFNAFLLWDVRQMIALNHWRRKNRKVVAHWFRMIAEMEVLNSLSTIHFNYPQWTFPELSTQHFTFNGVEIGHPLIPASTRVTSDFDIHGTARIALVTGSNMAGKSTFLRALGVNIVLAQLGSVVCASALTISPARLVSSMRIADNLAENTSTFYAELKKLKTIIEAVNRHEKVFILLDEILRGTNSFDRHTGSAALMEQLIRQKAVAVIATHDVELATLSEKYPDSIENYHFDVQVSGEELYFDYHLKHGVCTSLNASILMKKIGIELS